MQKSYFFVLIVVLLFVTISLLHADESLDFESIQNAIVQAEKDSNNFDLSQAYKSMAIYYANREDYKDASFYFLKYIKLHEDIIISEFDYRIEQLEFRYQASQKEKELELLRREQKLKDSEVANSRNERNMLIVISLLVIVLVVVFLNRYHLHTRLHKKLDELNKKLIDLAETDSLTKLYNRRFIIDKINYLKHQFERTKTSFSIIIGDMNNFKEVNDTFGHDIGDMVLMQLSETMEELIRKQDFVGRWGGDEFILVLPDTDEEGAQTIAYKIENTVAQTNFGDHSHLVNVGITFGFAEYDKVQEATELVKKADISLYIRKEEHKQFRDER